MNDYLKMADVTDASKIMDTPRNDNNSDAEDLDYIDFDENIEISLAEEIFDERSDPEDIAIVDIEEQVAEEQCSIRKITTSRFQR